MVDEYVHLSGKVIEYEGKVRIEKLQNVLNEYALKGYKLVNLHQYHFDGLQYSLIMMRCIQ